jgi:hypothetical protein
VAARWLRSREFFHGLASHDNGGGSANLSNLSLAKSQFGQAKAPQHRRFFYPREVEMQTRSPSTRVLFSQLSAQRRMLVRLCQQTNYGSVRDLEVRERQPVFDPPPVVLMDLKLGGDDEPRAETDLGDFAICREVLQLLDRLDELVTVTIESIEIRAGIPRRLIFRAAIPASSGGLR